MCAIRELWRFGAVALLTCLAVAGCGGDDAGTAVATDGGAVLDPGPGAGTDVGSTSSVDTDGARATADAGPAGTDPGSTESDEGPPCSCISSKHCNPAGVCVEDLCLKASTTCDTGGNLRICNDDGSDFETEACTAGTVCFLGECVEPVCDPDDPPVCEDGMRKLCNSLGVDYNYLPCPGVSFCRDGECQRVEPNVLVIVDTSGSMNAINAAGVHPADCEGDGCPAWTWPGCDDPDVPQTRLGRVKTALQRVLESEIAANVRLAMQRFPQNFNLFSLAGSSAPTCDGAPLWGLDKFSGDNNHAHQNHEVEASILESNSLAQILPVPFGDDAASARDAIMRWIDFEHGYAVGDETCAVLTDCTDYNASMACVDGGCGTLEEPELRAMGNNTPIGRSLFYAGEILRSRVVVEGKACAEDVDCGSPHYACVGGTCHDPARTCRPNVVALFTDGLETFDVFPDKFFNPRVQAKRLHYGLGCDTTADCLNGAACEQGVCTAAVLAEPDKICHGTSVSCTGHTECRDFPFPCGGTASTCSGRCEETGRSYTDDVGANVLRDATGAPIAVTVHVIDAAGGVTDAATIALLGGGEHVQVDVDDIASIIAGFETAFDVKVDPAQCTPPQP